MNRKRIGAPVGVLLAVLLVGIGIWFATRSTGASADGKYAAGSSAGQGKIKVGIIVSEYTASGPHWTSEPYGHHAGSTAWVLRDPALDLYPILEPGTEDSDEIQGILKKSFPGKKPINGASKEELKTLDVIVTGRAWNTPDEVLNAIEAAVSDGVGFLDWGSLGIVTPGHGEQVDRINGFAEGQYGLGRHQVECEVIGEHPILGKLAKGRTITLTANGEYGVLRQGGIGLIQIKDPDSYFPVGQDLQRGRDDFVFYPLYVTSLGKGKVIGLCIPSWGGVPKQLDQAVGGKFLLRCVKWLAGRPVD